MSTTQDHPAVNTTRVFWWLLVLTVLEVGVTFVPIPRLSIVILLIALAVTKAAMVMIEFMHLRFERRMVWLIACAPVLLAVALVLGLVPDAVQTLTDEKPEAWARE